MSSPFLPMSLSEMKRLGFNELDILIVTGDAYVDHPAYGAALIGRLLESKGYKVGIIAEPDWRDPESFIRLGRPRLAALITAGAVDSMIVNYTANKRLRRDSYSYMPDRASIVYTNRIRAAFKGIPVILGGTEASMRRLAHYDYWDDSPRRSLLLDSKADMIVYGMAERPIVEVINRLNNQEPISSIRDVAGTVVAVKPSEVPSTAVMLPSFEEVLKDKILFNKAFALVYREMNAVRGKPVAQPHADRVVLQLPPAKPLTTQELDNSYDLPYARRWHPAYDAKGGVKGFEVVRWSITAVRGCPADCSFCGLTMHQGRVIQSRSERSILQEVDRMVKDRDFRGTITDVGGPTANLYAASCKVWDKAGPCSNKQCMMPHQCPSLELGYAKALSLYRSIRRVKGVKHVFIGSGLRYDLLVEPESQEYLRELCEHHISGQMKVAPEHTQDKVLRLMNKPSYLVYERFVEQFEKINRKLPSRRYLVNYFITSHPGCDLNDAKACAEVLDRRGMRPEQVQDFIPLPMTMSACLYYTGTHPITGERLYVPKTHKERTMQRALIQLQNEKSYPLIAKAKSILSNPRRKS
ncbi:MAG: YgiQ family radical SAM protein [Candidatus Omnitrophica bacterium]|nr:YgiQ family radical SAM protein [Candidatus Omnitrophota bacterium]